MSLVQCCVRIAQHFLSVTQSFSTSLNALSKIIHTKLSIRKIGTKSHKSPSFRPQKYYAITNKGIAIFHFIIHNSIDVIDPKLSVCASEYSPLIGRRPPCISNKAIFPHHTNIASQLRTKCRDVRMSKLRIREYINSVIMESKHDIMYPKSDNSRKDIVEFVKEVEKYPCLYNKTLPEYANKMHNRRAWSAIAKRANTSVPECRDRWRKIRISFMRSLKQQASTKPPMRPYYLTEELHFLHPFLSIRPKTYEKEKLPKDSNMDVELAPMENHDTSDDSASLASFESDPVENTPEIDRAAELNKTAEFNRAEIINKAAEINRIVEMNRFTYNDNTIPNIMNGGGGSIENGHGRQNGGRNSNSDDIECNPRKMFLLSMLPDIEQLTEPEMRIFRREVISTIDKIIGDRSIGVNRIKILGN